MDNGKGLNSVMREEKAEIQKNYQKQENDFEKTDKITVTKKLVKFLFAVGIFSFGYNFVTTAEYVHFRKILEDVGFESSILVSVLFSISLIALCIGAVFGGIISDKIRSKFGQRIPSIFLGSVGAGILFITIPLITQVSRNLTTIFILLSITFTIAHLLLGGAYPAWFSLLSDLFKKKERTLASVVITIFSATGAAIAIMIFSKLVDNGFSWIIWIITGLALAIGGVLTSILIPRENPEEPSNVKLSDVGRIPKLIWKYGGLPWVLLLVVNTFWGFSSHLVETGLVDSLVNRFSVLGTTASLASNILMGIYIAIFLLPIIWLVNRIGKITASIIASFCYAVFCLLLAFMNNFNAIYYIVVIGGVSNILISILQIALPADIVPKGREASFMGIFFVFSTAIKPLATLVQGFLLEGNENIKTLAIFGGYPWSFVLASISCAIAMIIMLTMYGRKQKKRIMNVMQSPS
ncbi:MAG: MFS transporter [Candidatus Heimdallarchaeota archaeon]